MSNPTFIARQVTLTAPATGTWSVTHPELVARGITPKAVIVMATAVDSATNEDISADASGSWGVYDGTDQAVQNWFSKDAQTTSECKSGFKTSKVARVGGLGTETTHLEMNTTGFISGGCDFNVTTSNGSQVVRVTILFFGGTELDVAYFSAFGNASTVTVTPGFETDLIFASGRDGVGATAETDIDYADYDWSLLIARNDGAGGFDDVGSHNITKDAQVSVQNRSIISNDRAKWNLDLFPTASRGSLTFENVTATQFDLRQYGVAEDLAAFGLAMDLGTVTHALEKQDFAPKLLPLDNIINYTDIGFRPELIYSPGCYRNIITPITGLSSGGGMAGIINIFAGQDFSGHHYSDQHGVTTTVSKSMVEDGFFWSGLYHDGRSFWEGVLTPTSTGFDILWNSNSTVSYRWQYIAVERQSYWLEGVTCPSVEACGVGTLRRMLTETSPTVTAGATDAEVRSTRLVQMGQLSALLSPPKGVNKFLVPDDASQSLLTGQEYTIEVWIYLENGSVSSEIFGRNEIFGSSQSYELLLSGTNLLFNYVPGTVSDTGKVDIGLKRWTQVLIEVSVLNNFISMRINNDPCNFNSKLTISDGTVLSSVSTNGLIIGANPSFGGSCGHFRIARFRKWDRLFDESESESLWYDGKGLSFHDLDDVGFDTDLEFAYEFSEYALDPAPSVPRRDFTGSAPSIPDAWTRPSTGGVGGALCAANATGAAVAQRIVQGTVVADAATAAVSIDADGIKQTTVTVQAETATTAIAGIRRMLVTMTPQASTATVVTDVDEIKQTDPTVQSITATVAISADELKHTDIAAQASTALVVISADEIKQTDPAVQASTALVVVDADYRTQTDISVQASTATVATDADKIVQTSPTVQAATATVVIGVGSVAQTDSAVQAATATVVLDGDRISQTDPTVQADTATVTISADELKQTDTSLQASTALLSIDADYLTQTSTTVQASTATTVIEGIVGVISGGVIAQASTATVATDVDEIKQTDSTVQASTATVTISASEIKQTDIVIQVSTALVAVDADYLTQTSPTVQAATATVVLDATPLTQTSTAVQAVVASIVTDADKIAQTSPALQSATATASVVGTAAAAITGDVVAQASTALAITSVDEIKQTDIAVQTSTAIAATSLDLLRHTTVTVQASTALVSVSADPLTQTDTAAQATTATTVFDISLPVQADVATQASTATTAIPATKIHVVDVAVQAETAATAIDGTLVQSTGVVIAVSTTALLATDADLIRQTSTAVQAATATLTLDADKITQTDPTVQASTAVASVDVQKFLLAASAAQASTALVVAVGQKIVQTAVAVQAETATASALSSAIQVQGAVVAQAAIAITVSLGQKVSQAAAALLAGAGITLVPSTKISQTDSDVQAETATASIIAFPPARPHAPSTIFEPDVSRVSMSPATLTVVVAEPTTHNVTRKFVDTVWVTPRVTNVVTQGASTIFETDTTHRIAFRTRTPVFGPETVHHAVRQDSTVVFLPRTRV